MQQGQVIRRVSLVKRSDLASGRTHPNAKMGASFRQDAAQTAQLLKYMQFAMLAGFIVLIALLANFSTTNYRLFATTSEGKLNIPPPVDQDIGDNIVSLWLTDAMVKIMTMGYHDYQLRLLEIRPLFNDRGWDSFTRFQRSPYGSFPAIRAALENNYLTMKARPRTPPQIIERSLVGGVFTYRVQVRLIVTRESTEGSESLSFQNYELLIERVKPEINPAGIAIAQWRFTGIGTASGN